MTSPAEVIEFESRADALPLAPPSTTLATSNGPVFDRADHVELGERLVEDLGGADELVFDDLHPWRYDGGCGLWRQIDRAEESRIVQTYAGAMNTKGKAVSVGLSDVRGAIQLAHDVIARHGFFAGAAGVAFSNCVVRATSTGIEVLPHARDHRARAGYDFPYERGLRPERFLEFLAALFRDDDDRETKSECLQEFSGACVLGAAPRFQRCIIGVGDGDNGKSALASVMLACMPPGTTSAIPPQDWGQEYRRAMLVGKHLNAVGELPEREIIASEAFKAIVAGDPIVGRIIRESPLMLRPIAGHYFAANRLPGTTDQTEGFWRRFVVVAFNRSFKGDPARDPHIVEKILASERAGIVAWMLEGAERLIRARDYTIPESHHRALADWRKNADQVALFVDACTRMAAANERGERAAVLYERYRRWAERNGHRAVASNSFGQRLRLLGLAAVKREDANRYPLVLLEDSGGLLEGSDGSAPARNVGAARAS